jgi:hypothetical protein
MQLAVYARDGSAPDSLPAVALNEAEERAAAGRAEEVRGVVGHPLERWQALQARVQNESIQKFADILDDFLALMWCLDRYRVAQAPPQGMGKPGGSWSARLEGVYRSKGNWFAILLALLLDNRTGERLRSRGQIEGFSQNHQIDLAWPDRRVAPVICAESKLTGAPGFGTTRARGAMDDWSNRRKELKFASTDLKLHRRDQSHDIGHWDVWRRDALPKCFMLWAARMAPGDRIGTMIREAAAVVRTYLDGAGILAWRENPAADGYELVPLPGRAAEWRVLTLDDTLWQIESEIKGAVSKGLGRRVPDLAEPVDRDALIPDA